jgi:hypothetical protein
VLDPAVASVKLTRVLIDGGSSLNLLFMSALRKMGLDITDMLTPSKAPFYGIVPGNSTTPFGSEILLVTFGIRENYMTEYIKFEVADFESSYHAILGRPALVKFMVVPHYVYLLLKMIEKSGVLTFRVDLKKSYDCDQEAIEYALTTRTCQILHQKYSQPRNNYPSQSWRSRQRRRSPSYRPPGTSHSRQVNYRRATRPRQP